MSGENALTLLMTVVENLPKVEVVYVQEIPFRVGSKVVMPNTEQGELAGVYCISSLHRQDTNDEPLFLAVLRSFERRNMYHVCEVQELQQYS